MVGDRVAAEDVLGGDAGLVLAHVGEERPAVDVADRVEPVPAADSHPVVDLDRPAVRVGVDGLEPEAGDARRPSRRRRAGVAPPTNSPSSRSSATVPASGSLRAPMTLAPGPDRHAALAERVGDLLGRELLLAEEDAVGALDDRRPRSRASSRPAPSRCRRPRRRGSAATRGASSPLVISRFDQAPTSARPSIGGIAVPDPVAITIAVRGLQLVVAGPEAALADQLGTFADQRDVALLQPGELSVVGVGRGRPRRAGRGSARRRARPTNGIPGTRSTSASSSAGRSSAFDGMQAQKLHSPPTSSGSASATSRPPSARRPAATSPAGPAPITITSNSLVLIRQTYPAGCETLRRGEAQAAAKARTGRDERLQRSRRERPDSAGPAQPRNDPQARRAAAVRSGVRRGRLAAARGGAVRAARRPLGGRRHADRRSDDAARPLPDGVRRGAALGAGDDRRHSSITFPSSPELSRPCLRLSWERYPPPRVVNRRTRSRPGQRAVVRRGCRSARNR